MKRLKGFFAYPSAPAEIGQCIESAVTEFTQSQNDITLDTWGQLDIVGHFISDEVIDGINNADFLIADISNLNFNVTYEIGYAIGQSKRVLLTKNKSINSEGIKVEDVGIFDTLGYEQYQNSHELLSYISTASKAKPLDITEKLNHQAPVYLLETPFKTDWSGRVISRIKKSGYTFRNFDPNEQPRLSAYDAINQAASSFGIVVPLLSKSLAGNEIHNLRAAFIAGLADGMKKALCIVQSGDDPVPLDYRDFVNVTYHPDEIDEVIAVFASQVAKAFQEQVEEKSNPERSFLKNLNLGATSAENEMRDLSEYYLETDQYLKTLRGEAHLVVGRKGSGKSAIFLQIRDMERARDRSKNIVLDLKPDGYKLIKFKERILSYLEEGTYLHTVTAFWEYVLLLEICYKIIEKDKKRHLNNHYLYEGYRNLVKIYNTGDYDPEGDFSERMSNLMEKIYTDYQSIHGGESQVRLSSGAVTQLIYMHDVKKLRNELINYMGKKGVLWLLFDNIDNGWPTSGVEHNDLLIIRALIDATRKIERVFGKNSLDVKTAVFIRNDVYELLVKQTADRGKEASVLLDWTDPDLLKELVRLRIVANDLDEETNFQSAWLKIIVSHYKGEETSRYFIERSLMRPRFLLNLINHCKGFAINLNHDKIDESDIVKGLAAYSSDLLRDIGYELRDIASETENILYSFIGCDSFLTEENTLALISQFSENDHVAKKIFNLLLWYGFLGIRIDSEEPKYIYDFSYNKDLMDGIKSKSNSCSICVNPAFWSALMINQ